MNSIIHNIFEELQRKEHSTQESLCVSALPFSKFHKIGISHANEPMFFIKCNESCNSIDINLDLISIMFDRNCKVIEGECFNEGVFSVIKLNSDNVDLQYYFIDVVCLVLQQLPSTPSQRSLLKEINKIIDLFKSLSSTPKKTIQGLWAELLVIEQSSNPEFLIKSWHSSPEDKFDFNDGKDKIEVKSTTKSQRIHTFSINQLNPNEGSLLIIASTFVIQTGIGKSIADLKNMIMERIEDFDVQIKLNEQIIRTLGVNFEKSVDLYFDYQAALDSLAFYNHRDIPTIKIDSIQANISNVRFDADLTFVIPICLDDNIVIDSKLLNSLKNE